MSVVRLRALVADDEPMARTRLRRLLERDGGIEVVAECGDGEATLSALQETRPDLAFLDIRMPALDGFQVLQRIDRTRTQVVFVTAHADHAVRAFDEHATDYLLKPLTEARLQTALRRVREVRARDAAAAGGGAPGAGESAYPRRIAVPLAGRMHLLPVADIDLASAQGNYVRLRVGAREYLLRETLGGLLARLDPKAFVHVHRSHAVRIEAVRDIETLESGQYLLRLHNGERVATGRSYRPRLREALGLP
jgi:two-component system LytT family response regulator